MKDISELESTQFYFFPVGKLPFKHLLTRDAIDRIREAFHFKGIGLQPGVSELIWEGGVLNLSTGEKITVTRLQIADRRVIVQAAADAKATNVVFAAVKKLMEQQDPSGVFQGASPISLRQETTCIVTLECDWSSFFSPKMASFIDDVAKAASDRDATVSLSHVQCRFALNYRITRESLSQSGITLAQKEFIVEPVVGVPLAERRFFTSSPTDSDTHLRLIGEIEKALTATAGRHA